MKLYVWHDVLCDYTCGVMFAIAESPEHARKLIVDSGDLIKEEDLATEPEEHDLDTPYAVTLWGGG